MIHSCFSKVTSVSCFITCLCTILLRVTGMEWRRTQNCGQIFTSKIDSMLVTALICFAFDSRDRRKSCTCVIVQFFTRSHLRASRPAIAADEGRDTRVDWSCGFNFSNVRLQSRDPCKLEVWLVDFDSIHSAISVTNTSSETVAILRRETTDGMYGPMGKTKNILLFSPEVLVCVQVIESC